MIIHFDVNVVLDFVLAREPWGEDARALVAFVLADRVTGCVAATTVPTVYYVVRKTAGRGGARLAVAQCLGTFAVASVGKATLDEAFAFDGRDFEDDVQIAAAVAAGADVIVTRDPADFAASPVRVASPAALRAELEATLPPINGRHDVP